jgi:hypothetical protein
MPLVLGEKEINRTCDRLSPLDRLPVNRSWSKGAGEYLYTLKLRADQALGVVDIGNNIGFFFMFPSQGAFGVIPGNRSDQGGGGKP